MNKPVQGHTVRKRFGQNFLHDQQIINRILQSISPQSSQTIVEIGPGLGALTKGLVESNCRLHLVELDRDLVTKLQLTYQDNPNVTIHSADALKFDFSSLSEAGQAIRLVGNLPYNISTPLIFHLLKQADCISDMHFMLQKEVVERLAASPAQKSYGRLTVMVQYHCLVENLFIVPPSAFTPAPRVDSAIVCLSPHSNREVIANDAVILENVVRQAFGQRRKTLRNNLKPLLSPEQIESLGIDPAIRPERVTPSQFVQLANLL